MSFYFKHAAWLTVGLRQHHFFFMPAALMLYAALLSPAGFAFEEPFPVWQAVPLPASQVSLRRGGAEIARYHFSPEQRRPFLYPLLGPSGKELTRMSHPRDPVGHSHHNSVWVSHHMVNDVNFWADDGSGKIVHERVERYEDGAEEASFVALSTWMDEAKKVPLLKERRRVAVRQTSRDKDWLMIVDLELSAVPEKVTLGKTSFGPLAVRMAKTIGVHDGGGRMLNSEGGLNEKGVFWKRARWVDYSGQSAPKTVEGITLMDHPRNPNHPNYYHVRDDGWMGVALTHEQPLVIERAKPLKLRYGLYIHAGAAEKGEIDKMWEEFSRVSLVAEQSEHKK